MTEHRLPPITMTAEEADRLSDLSDAAARSQPDVAALLERELSRATIVAAGRLPADVVRVGSRVTFRDGDGAVATVTLVLPGDANVSEGRVSVLTPVGAALVGMAVGQTIRFAARRGERALTILDVGDDGGASATRG